MRRSTTIMLTLFAFVCTILVAPAWLSARIIHVDSGCGDTTTYAPTLAYPDRCDGGSDESWDDISDVRSGGPGAMQAGDTVFIRAGAYPRTFQVHGDPSLGLNHIPSGSTMATATRISAYPLSIAPGCDPYGTLSQVRACYANTYEEVILNPATVTAHTSAVIGLKGASPVGGGAQIENIIIEGLILDGAGGIHNGINLYNTGSPCGTASQETAPNDVRFLNLEVRGMGNQGVLASAYTHDNWFLNMNVHHNGRDLHTDHGLYLAGRNLLVDGGQAWANRQYGVHFWHSIDPDCPYFGGIGSVVQGMRIYGNRTGVIVTNHVQGVTIRNNLIYGNANGGLFVGSAFGDVKYIYHNTVMNNGTIGIQVNGSDVAPPQQDVRNNVTDRLNLLEGSQTSNRTVSNNWVTPTNGDPLFVDPISGDFRLRDGSPLIDAGTDLTAAGVTEDFAYTARPQGAGWDIGAYERATGDPTPFDFTLTNEWLSSGLEATCDIGTAIDTDITATLASGTGAAVSFAALNLPKSVTPSFSQASCTPTCTSTLTLTVGVDAPSGRHPITVRATAGALTRSTSFDLTITCP